MSRLSTLRTSSMAGAAVALAGCAGLGPPPEALPYRCAPPTQGEQATAAGAEMEAAALERRARGGDAVAARLLGDRYSAGDGMPQDPEKALTWYRRAAFKVPPTAFIKIPKIGDQPGFVLPIQQTTDAADPQALATLAGFYAAGRLVAQDQERAARLLACAVVRGLSSPPSPPTATTRPRKGSLMPDASPPAARTVSHLFGEIVWLMTQSPLHRTIPLADLEWMIMPPLMLEQVKVFHDKTGRPLAYVSWALLSEETEAHIVAETLKLPVSAWNSGDRCWLVDFVCPTAKDTTN